MARVAINTGSVANDGTGDSLRIAGGKINSNFSEIYNQFGDGTNLTPTWSKFTSGINTTSSVGIGTTNPRFTLEVGAVGASGTSLYVNGNARITGILTVGSSSIILDGAANKILVGSGISFDGNTGIISATAFYASGALISGGGGGGGGLNYWLSGATGITTTSNVGIATNSAPSALTVGGNSLFTGITTFRNDVVLSKTSSSNTLYFGNNVYITQNTSDVVTFQNNTTTDGTGTDGSFVFKTTESNNSPIPNIQLDALRIYSRGNYWNGLVRIYTNLHADQNAFIGGDLQVGAASTLIGAGNTLGSFKVGTGGTVITTTSSGLVGIGTTNPTSKLTVSGDVNVTGVATASAYNVGQTKLTNGNLNLSGNIYWGNILLSTRDLQFIGEWDGGSNYGDYIFYQRSSFGGLSEVARIKGINGDFNTSGSGNFTGNLHVSGISTFAGITTVTGPSLFTKQLSVSGVVTATSFSGSGSGLTNIPSGQLTGALPALDGSALINVVGSGSGIIVKDDGSTIGTAGTIDFGTGISVSPISAGIVTITSSGGTSSQWVSTAAGIHTLSNVGIGTTNPTSAFTVNGNVSVSGVSTFVGSVTIQGGTSFTNTSESTSKDSGSVVFEGGVGIEKRLNVGGNFASYGSYANFGDTSRLQFDVGASDSPNVRIRNIFVNGRIRMDSPSGIDLEQYNTSSAYRARFDDTNVSLYSQNSLKLQTIGAGVTITGTTFTNQLSVSGVVTATSFSGSNTLKERTTVTGVTTSIANNGIGNTNITGFKSYALLKVGLSTEGWLRLYTDSTSRSNDASRSVGIDPSPGSGVIAEIVTTGISTTQIISPFVMGGNLNDPADTTIYAAITNLSGVTTSISVNLTLLQLEA